MFGWEENKWGRKIWKENKNVFPLILFGLKENRLVYTWAGAFD